jgi:hypothetical protein
MKKYYLLILGYCIFYSSALHSFDTISTNKNQIQLGAKIIYERSGYPQTSPKYNNVINGGFQYLYKPKYRFVNFESGLYFATKVLQLSYPNLMTPPYEKEKIYWYYNFIELPLNVRFETKHFYFSSGLIIDYFLFKYNSAKKSNSSFNNKWNDTFFNLGVNHCIGIQKKIDKYKTVFFEIRYSDNYLQAYEYPKSYVTDIGFVNYGCSLGFNFILK